MYDTLGPLSKALEAPEEAMTKAKAILQGIPEDFHLDFVKMFPIEERLQSEWMRLPKDELQALLTQYCTKHGVEEESQHEVMKNLTHTMLRIHMEAEGYVFSTFGPQVMGFSPIQLKTIVNNFKLTCAALLAKQSNSPFGCWSPFVKTQAKYKEMVAVLSTDIDDEWDGPDIKCHYKERMKSTWKQLSLDDLQKTTRTYAAKFNLFAVPDGLFEWKLRKLVTRWLRVNIEEVRKGSCAVTKASSNPDDRHCTCL